MLHFAKSASLLGIFIPNYRTKISFKNADKVRYKTKRPLLGGLFICERLPNRCVEADKMQKDVWIFIWIDNPEVVMVKFPFPIRTTAPKADAFFRSYKNRVCGIVLVHFHYCQVPTTWFPDFSRVTPRPSWVKYPQGFDLLPVLQLFSLTFGFSESFERLFPECGKISLYNPVFMTVIFKIFEILYLATAARRVFVTAV